MDKIDYMDIFGIFGRLRALEAKVAGLDKDLALLDPAELTRLRQTVLNSLRGLHRIKQVEEDREEAAPAAVKRPHPWVAGGKG